MFIFKKLQRFFLLTWIPHENITEMILWYLNNRMILFVNDSQLILRDQTQCTDDKHMCNLNYCK